MTPSFALDRHKWLRSLHSGSRSKSPNILSEENSPLVQAIMNQRAHPCTLKFSPVCHWTSPPSPQHRPAGWEHSKGLFSTFSQCLWTPAYSITEHGPLLACLSTVWANLLSSFLLVSLFSHPFFACLHYLTLLNLKTFPVGQSNRFFHGKVFIPKILFFRKWMLVKQKISPVFLEKREKHSSAGVD